jgi:hypothetical protein
VGVYERSGHERAWLPRGVKGLVAIIAPTGIIVVGQIRRRR